MQHNPKSLLAWGSYTQYIVGLKGLNELESGKLLIILGMVRKYQALPPFEPICAIFTVDEYA